MVIVGMPGLGKTTLAKADMGVCIVVCFGFRWLVAALALPFGDLGHGGTACITHGGWLDEDSSWKKL
ncbi:hypothetical protein Pyn_27160 [Prunus yedoensis var. nudiflora]|uniref:Uncharacterized protein n=1 Tax=Prunus yedoensis var. nudiflora TaxID=2094558 RepID=A0A314YK54_PRUYE|nr:hypothetical protein Pyn_27160 [Prunus yedoensis var. nudiflora]